MIRHMQLRRYASTPQEQYVRAVVGFAQFSKRSPEHLTPDEMHTYLHHLLVDRGLAWNTCNVIAAGLRCLSLDVLGWKARDLNLPSRRGRIQLPRVLSTEELERLFEAATNPKHRALLMTTYGAGLRVSEVVHLRLPDIESARMLLRVNQGQGFKDRSTLLSPRLLTELRASWKQYRPDPWLFPSSDRERPLHRNSALRAYEQARQRANISRGRGIHTRRQSFATHLLEADVPPHTIQSLLGHRSLQTTMRSLQVTQQQLSRVRSPFDLLRFPSASALLPVE
jgi:integrase